MIITVDMSRNKAWSKVIRLIMVLAILLGTFPITMSQAASETLIDVHFDSGQDGFSYADDTFRGTNQPSYASGVWGSGYGFAGGGLRVYVGAVNTNTIYGMSGGWSETFNLTNPGTVTISFHYQLTIASEYESDEYGQALFSLDGILHGNDSNDYLAQINGNGNGGSHDSTGWQQYTGQFSLSSGDHTITIGAYNNKKTYNNEWVEVLLDNVSVTAGNAPPNANAGPDQTLQDANQDGFELVILDGTASYDIDGTIVSYEWSESGLPLASGTTPAVNLSLGIHTITLTVTDNEGEIDIDQVEISITEPPEAQAIVDRLDYNNFKSVIKSLNDFGDRCQMSGCSLTSYNNAQAWLEGELSAMGYTVERHYYTYNSSTRASTYVTKVGTVHPDQMYMVACHLDGRGGGGAADDNGSGCALLFEGARVLAQPDVETDISIRFLFWGNEETGLHGSTQYRDDRYSLQGIEDPPGSGIYPEPTWLGNITHDMILYDHGVPAQSQQIAAADIDVEYRDGTTYEAQSRDLALYLQGANERYSTGIPSSPRHYPAEVNDYSTNTDDTPYHNYCPSISVRENRRLDEISGVHPYYHTSADIYENYSELDFQLGFNTVQMTIGAVAELAGARIISTNNPPVADSQSVMTDEDTPIAITLTGFDPDSDPITFNVTNGPSQGNLTGAPPNVTYSPAPDFNGSDSFQFVVNDGTVNSSLATVSITVNPINDPPVADSQSIATVEGTPLAITLTGSDVDNDPLGFSVVTGPINGSLTGTAPNLTYTPDPGISGADSFTFFVNDGMLDSNLATISITINAVNDPPAADDQSLSTNEEVPLGITLTGNDPENDPLSFNVTGGPSNGSLSGILPDLTYTPDDDFYGSDSFTFVTNDGEFDSAPATVSITVNPVNDAPVADDQAVTTDEDIPTSITLTGSDVDNDPLSFSINAGPSHGILSGSAPNLTYTPDADFNGSDGFTFRVNDGSVDSTEAMISITITPVNDQPVAAPQSLSTDEDTPLAIILTGLDVEGDLLTFSVTNPPLHGSLSGSAPNLTYTPHADFDGMDSLTFVANDGLLDSAPAAISITVNPFNDAPVADPQSVTTQQDTPLAITLTASDVDGDSLTFNVSDMPTHGTLSGTAPDLTYTPDPGYIGTDNFTFTAFDGTIDSEETQVDITITKVNHAPVADPQSVSADEDTPLGITLTGSDSDGDPLTYAVTVQPTHGSLSGTAPNLTYTPDANYNGTDSFSFIANDGLFDSDPAVISITVNPVNDLPIAGDQSVTTDEDIPLDITLSGSDIDGDPLSFLIVSGPSNGSLTGPAPNLTYTPDANFNGTDSFTFLVNDGTVNSALATVEITINPVNDQPVADSQAVTTAEDTPIAITMTGSDIDGDSLTYQVGTGPTNGTLSGSGASLTYTPDADFNGIDSFTFTASDGTIASAPATVNITITSVNDQPTADDQTISTIQDTPVDITLTGLDIDGDPLTFSVVTGPTNGSLSGTAPDLTYTPNAGYAGSDSFTFVINDGTADSDVASVEITITPAGPSVVFEDDFETNKGWIEDPNNTDSATTGMWERANPEGVSYYGDKQLGTTVSGTYDLVTGPLAGSSAGSYDIDSGVTSIRSPEFSLPAGQELTLSFYYYLAHASNSSSSDFLRVKVVGTTTTTVFEELGASNDDDASWAQFTGSLNAFEGQTVYLLIEAADASGGSLVEAGIDDVLVMAEPIIPSTTLLEANFDTDSDGFTYQDDTFRNTNQPSYATGTYQGSGGYSGGGLQVYLGGVNTTTINNMSGGWQDTFTLSSPAEVILSFYYQLTQASEYESDEYSQALISVDGVLYGLNGNDYLAQINGDGNGGSERSTGWNLVEINLGTLSAGEHTIIIGGYNNKKTYNNEWTEILIDSVKVAFR